MQPLSNTVWKTLFTLTDTNILFTRISSLLSANIDKLSWETMDTFKDTLFVVKKKGSFNLTTNTARGFYLEPNSLDN